MRKLSRNDLCWCGSGKKYKKCHMFSDIDKGIAPDNKIKTPPGVIIKNKEQIKGILKSSQLAKKIMNIVSKKIKKGITTNDIDNLVHEITLKNGAAPAPLNYNGFPKSVCTSLNNVICHGIPDETVLQEGDILNVDITCNLNGYYGDIGRMFLLGKVSENAEKLVRIAEECLQIGIDLVKPYTDMGEIGYAIEQYAKKQGYSVVRDYGGHGVGLRFHEEPHVHHFGSKKRGIIMLPGMIFTVEPMINEGRYQSRLLSDNWTAVTADGSLSAQWEHTVLVTGTGVEVLTG